MIPVDRISSDDLTLALNHYSYVFECRPFSSKATGKNLKLFTDAEEKDLMRYVEEQSNALPDDIFIVLEPGSDPIDEIFDDENGEPENIGMSIFGDSVEDSDETDADDIFDFPGGNTEHRWEQKSAASRKTDDPFDDLL
jgi:hypothetical protein